MKCKSCGTISVVLTKDLWKLGQCPKCESRNLVNLDDEFSLVDVIGDKINDNKTLYMHIYQ